MIFDCQIAMDRPYSLRPSKSAVAKPCTQRGVELSLRIQTPNEEVALVAAGEHETILLVNRDALRLRQVRRRLKGRVERSRGKHASHPRSRMAHLKHQPLLPTDALKTPLSGGEKRPFGRLSRNTARMLRADLKAARTTWIEASGSNEVRERRKNSDLLLYRTLAGVADFHSLRHTFISAIVSGGASVKVAQELARHSTPTLTIGRYSHSQTADMERALEQLPVPPWLWSRRSGRISELM